MRSESRKTQHIHAIACTKIVSEFRCCLRSLRWNSQLYGLKKHEKWNFTPSCGYWIFRILNECVLICGNSLRKVKFVWAVHAILPYHTIHVIFELNEAFERGRRRTRKRRKTKSRVIKRVFYWWNVNDVERVDVVGSRKVYVLVKMKSNPILLCMYTAKCFFYVLLRFVCVFVDFHTVAKHFNYYSYFMYEYGM